MDFRIWKSTKKNQIHSRLCNEPCARPCFCFLCVCVCLLLFFFSFSVSQTFMTQFYNFKQGSKHLGKSGFYNNCKLFITP